MKVFVAIYEHRHGMDVCVFQSEEGAEAWRQQIAQDYWEEVAEDGGSPPEDRAEAADEYFQVKGEYCSGAAEFFNVEIAELQP